MTGISIIIPNFHSTAENLDRTLSAFFETNSHSPVELIVLDHANHTQTRETIARYATRGFIRHIKSPFPKGQNTTMDISLSAIFDKASYSKMLVINNNKPFTQESISNSFDKLTGAQSKTDIIYLGEPSSEYEEGLPTILSSNHAKHSFAGFIKEFTYLIKILGENRENNSFTIDNINVWPLVRTYLYLKRDKFSISEKGLEKLSQEADNNIHNPLINSTTAFITKTPCRRKPLDAGKQGDILLFLSRGKEYTQLSENSPLVHRYFDPLIDSMPEDLQGVKIDCSGDQNSGNYLYPSIKFDAPAESCQSQNPKGQVRVNPRTIEKFRNIFHYYGVKSKLSEQAIETFLKNTAKHTSYFDSLISRFNPRAVFLRCYYSVIWHPLLISAYKAKVPVIDLQHGRTGPYHPAYSHWSGLDSTADSLLPSLFWLWSENWANCLRSGQLADIEKRLLPAGDPWPNFSKKFVPAKTINTIDSIRTSFLKIILVSLQQYAHNQLPDYIKDAIANSQKDKVFWLIRKHPLSSGPGDLTDWVEKNCFPHVDTRLATRAPAHCLLEYVDVHLTHDSTFAYEAAELGVPTLYTSNSGDYSFADLIELDYAFRVDSYEQLMQKVEKLDCWELNKTRSSRLTSDKLTNILTCLFPTEKTK